MEVLIQIEELTMFLGCIYLFLRLNLRWWWFPALLLVPDLGMGRLSYKPYCGSGFIQHSSF